MNMNAFESGSRRRRSRAEVSCLVAAFEQSGLSRTEYCRQHGLSVSSMKRYRNRIVDSRRSQSVATAPSAAGVLLVPVEVVDRQAAHATGPTALFIELDGRLRIGVGAGFDVTTLRRLMAALGEA
jgi:transposase-like protein